MAKLSIVGISGSLSAPSRTLALVKTATDRIAHETEGGTHLIDIAGLPDIGSLRSRADADPAVEAALRTVETADLLVVGSPVYKGSYTGLFKHFIDFIDYRALIGTPVALLATGGSERHALVIEHQLRPLFAFFQAQPLGTGIFLTDRELANDEITDPVLAARFRQLIREGVDALSPRPWKRSESTEAA
jgi:FMN reductase